MLLVKAIPLTAISHSKLPNVAHQLGDLSKHTNLETPESVGLHQQPFVYVDSLERACRDEDQKTEALVLYEGRKIVANIGGIIVARYVDKKWSAQADKPPKRQNQLQMIGSGMIADQIGLGPQKMVELLQDGAISDVTDITDLECIVPQRFTNPRNRLLKLIGFSGMEEYPAETIGDSKPFISHSKVPSRQQVYCGQFVPIT